jgi:hypothetical protein
VSTIGKTGGILTNLPNPAAKKLAVQPVVVSPEAEEAFGLSAPKTRELSIPAAQPKIAATKPTEPQSNTPIREGPQQAQPERSKTFFLPYGVCDRLEMQKLSERREMKHIVRQALEEYFERNPLRPVVRDLYRDQS